MVLLHGQQTSCSYHCRCVFFSSFLSHGCTRRNLSVLSLWKLSTRLHMSVLSSWKLWTRWSNSACVTIDLRSRHSRINPRPTRFVSGKANGCRWRPRRYRVDPRSRRRGVARGVIRSSPKPGEGLVFAIGEGSRNFVVCFPHTRGQMFLYQTPGRRPPRITGRIVNTVWPKGGSEPLTSAPR